MPDTPYDRAQRVEKILKTGDCQGAMDQLQKEMGGVTDPNERRQVLDALKRQNDKDREVEHRLPKVDISDHTEWMGLVKKPGEVDVNFSQGAFDRLGMALEQKIVNNPVTGPINDALAGKKKD